MFSRDDTLTSRGRKNRFNLRKKPASRERFGDIYEGNIRN